MLMQPAQTPLWIDSIWDAQRQIVDHCGGAKVVGPELFPMKEPCKAAQALDDALNPSRAEKLDAEQFVRLFSIARRCGFHAAKWWFDAETGYGASAPAEPADQEAEQVRVLREAIQITARATEALTRTLDRTTRSKPPPGRR